MNIYNNARTNARTNTSNNPSNNNNSININDNDNNDVNKTSTFDDFDANKLACAIDDDSNDYLIHLTTLKIQELNLNILKELHLKKKDTLTLLKKLNGYKYVDELKELKYGRFIRWISIKNPETLEMDLIKSKMSFKGGMICEVKVRDDGIYIVYKNFMHKHYQFKMDECLIFQKLSGQELVLLSALDHLAEEASNASNNDNSSDISDISDSSDSSDK
jgi:hypothetical protein